MDNISLNSINTWDYEHVKKFISGSVALEGHHHDFKESLSCDNEKVRKLFCSFANSDGGIIIYGVNDSLKIVGVNRDTELQTTLSRILLTGILPLIDPSNWRVYEYQIPRKNKYIYLVAIQPSAHYDRPHIWSQKIYVRNNGSCDPVQDGRELRSKYLREKFIPTDISVLDDHMNALSNCVFSPDAIDIMYLKQLRKFLDDQLQTEGEDSKAKCLLQDYSVLIRLYEAIKQKVNLSELVGEMTTVFESESMVELQRKLKEKVEVFLKNFKEVYSL